MFHLPGIVFLFAVLTTSCLKTNSTQSSENQIASVQNFNIYLSDKGDDPSIVVTQNQTPTR